MAASASAVRSAGGAAPVDSAEFRISCGSSGGCYIWNRTEGGYNMGYKRPDAGILFLNSDRTRCIRFSGPTLPVTLENT